MIGFLSDFQWSTSSHKFHLEWGYIFANIDSIPEKLCEWMNSHCNKAKCKYFGQDFEFWKKILMCSINCLICCFTRPNEN